MPHRTMTIKSVFLQDKTIRYLQEDDITIEVIHSSYEEVTGWIYQCIISFKDYQFSRLVEILKVCGDI